MSIMSTEPVDIAGGKMQQFARLIRLQAVREAAGISRNRLHKLSGISYKTIEDAEKWGGYHYNTERVVRALAMTLGVEVSDIADINPEWHRRTNTQWQRRYQKLQAQRSNALTDLGRAKRRLAKINKLLEEHESITP